MADQVQDTAQIKHLTFEDAYAKLEKIVEQLETNSLPLDESLALFEEGQQLSAYCQQLLDKADLRVSTLISQNGTLVEIAEDEDKSDSPSEGDTPVQKVTLPDTETAKIEVPVPPTSVTTSDEAETTSDSKPETVKSDQTADKNEETD
jgi:exodeoxyribonuclease VII small subunit